VSTVSRDPLPLRVATHERATLECGGNSATNETA